MARKKKKKRALLHPFYWPIWLGAGLLRLSANLPLPWLWQASRLGGRLAYLMAGSRRRIVIRNLELCFPEYDRAKIMDLARENFQLMAFTVLTTGVNWYASRERLDGIIHFRGKEILDTALDAGQPVILLAPHFLGLEMCGPGIAKEGYAGVAMYQRIHNPVVDYLTRKGRGRFGTAFYERRQPILPIIRRIRQGAIFYYLPDQSPGRRHAVFVPFFGIQTATYPTLSRFARLARAQVIPCFSRFLPGGQGLEITFWPPLENFPGDDLEADTARVNRCIEEGIRRMPAQYLWAHRRFKLRPPGEPSLYEEKDRR
ncbi:MAG: lysophospholipid acyltransferase family protein [Deltaproteobacteria bacterium]|nr:lysophospholipid acyltransferase family protein [Deltaproteobacteria bacterium]